MKRVCDFYGQTIHNGIFGLYQKGLLAQPVRHLMLFIPYRLIPLMFDRVQDLIIAPYRNNSVSFLKVTRLILNFDYFVTRYLSTCKKYSQIESLQPKVNLENGDTNIGNVCLISGLPVPFSWKVITSWQCLMNQCYILGKKYGWIVSCIRGIPTTV